MITVVIPFRNGAQYLDSCIGSVLNQTYKDIEIICVDDGSDDGSESVCKKYSDKGVQYLRQEKLGVSVARNKGIDGAHGKYIMFLDVDDTLTTNIVEILYLEMESDESLDIIACCCNGILRDRTVVDHFFEGDFIATSLKEKRKLFLQLLDNQYGQPQKEYTAIGVPWGKLYRVDFLREKNIRFKKNLRRMQDNIFNQEAFYKAEKIKYLDQPLYNYSIDHIMHIGMKDPENMKSIILHHEDIVKLYLGDSEVEELIHREKVAFLVDSVEYCAMMCSNSKEAIDNIKNIAEDACYLDVYEKSNYRKSLYRRILIDSLSHKLYSFSYYLTRVSIIKKYIRMRQDRILIRK